jgi:hypothetical protein
LKRPWGKHYEKEAPKEEEQGLLVAHREAPPYAITESLEPTAKDCEQAQAREYAKASRCEFFEPRDVVRWNSDVV